MDPCVQIIELALKVCLVVLPCQPVYTGSGVAPERKVRRPEEFDVDMVEERSEPLFLPLPCGLPCAVQRL
jgi:hypothetical protein